MIMWNYFGGIVSSLYDSNWAILRQIILTFWISYGDNLLKFTLLCHFFKLLTQFCLVLDSGSKDVCLSVHSSVWHFSQERVISFFWFFLHNFRQLEYLKTDGILFSRKILFWIFQKILSLVFPGKIWNEN